MSDSTVAVVCKQRKEPARQEAARLEKWLAGRGVSTLLYEMGPNEPLMNREEEQFSIPSEIAWVVVLGGDGTLLGAARSFGKQGIPILGVNLGGLGFLTTVTLEQMYDVIEMMLLDRLAVEKRIMLDAGIYEDGGRIRSFQVLNDVVINHKAPLARIIDLDVVIDGRPLTTFRADGIIISTPTGSTAYNLSAGGPILYPTMETFVLTPICPFTLTNRPIIVPHTSRIEVKLAEDSKEDAVLTFDGQVGFDLGAGDRVVISKSTQKIHLLRPPEQDFFRVLKTKLMWGGSAYNGKRKK